MKRTVTFDISEHKYYFTDDDDLESFSIDRSSLQFDVKEFYQFFFSEGKNYENIEVTNTSELDKSATHVFNTVKQLISDICKRLNEDIDITNQEVESLEGESDENE